MSEQQNVETIRNAYAAYARGDLDRVMEAMAPEVDWQTFGPAELPMTGPHLGRAAVRSFFEGVAGIWSFDRFEAHEYVAQHDKVVALGFCSGTARVTGLPFACEWVHVFDFRDGRITRFREYTDTAQLLSALSPGVRI